MKKLTVCLLVVVMLFSSVSGVFAYPDSYLEFAKTDSFEFADNFDRYTSSVVFSGSGVNLDSNWRTSNASESDSAVDATERGFENGKLKIATNTSTVNIKYTTSNHKYFPSVVLNADRTGLANQQLIKVSAQKTHQSDMWGIRFQVHNGADNTLNYYTLLFAGMYTEGYNTQNNTPTGQITWGLYKCTNGVVTTLKEKVRTDGVDSADGYMGTGTAVVTISVIDGVIAWSLNYVNGSTTYSYNETYTDARPFDADGKDTTVHLYAAGSDDPSRFVRFDDFKLTNAVPYITTGEPDNVIYYNAASGKTADSENILDLGESVRIRKLLYDGTSANEKILISRDKQTWYRLADISDFSNGKFLNTVTSDYFRYITAADATKNLTVLTDITDYTGIYTDSALRLYPRVGGADYFAQNDNKLSSSDSNVATVNGNLVLPSGIGTATVRASDGTNSVSVNVTYKSNIYSYQDSFDNMGTENYTGANVQFNKSWRSKTSAEGKMGYNNDASVGYNSDRIFVQARGVKDGDSYSRYPRWAETVPAAVFNEDHSNLTQNQVIKMKISKTSGTETAGVRFMVHRNGSSYYALLFPGMYALGGLTDKDNYKSSWELIKCDGGQYTMLAYGECTGGADSADGFLAYGEGDLTIEYVDGKITWNMPVYSGSTKLFEWSGKYTDENPYTLSGNDSTVWLISGLYSGDTPSRGTYFDDIKISSYVPYITTDEPKTVIYTDITENKTAQNGIYTLDNPQSIRRINAAGVDGILNVYGSKDNNIWYKICSFTEDGGYLNNVYNDKFGYIKMDGKGTISVLSEIAENSMMIMPENSITIYPYIDGNLFQNPQIIEETGCVIAEGTTLVAKLAVKNSTVTVKCGSIDIPLKVTVPLLSAVCDVKASGNDAVINVTVPGLKNVDSQIAVIFFNADHSMNSVQTFKSSFSDEREVITVKDYYSKGNSAKLVIWNNTDNAAAYTKVVNLNTSK